MKLRVLFVQNTTNDQLVKKFRAMPRFRSLEFIPLVGEDKKVRAQLEQTSGPVVLIWGSGEQHDLSYHLTKKGIWLKVNLDLHSDTGFTELNYWPSHLRDPSPLYANHMKRTKDDGVEIITPNTFDSFASRFRWLKVLGYAERKGAFYGPDQIGVTIDCDVLPCFPVQEVWIKDTGLFVTEIIALILSLENRIGKLDIGGMLNNIPEFRLIEDIEKPTFEETLAFVRKFDNIARDSSPEVSQELIDKVCSYATMAYVRVLEAFAQVNGYDA